MNVIIDSTRSGSDVCAKNVFIGSYKVWVKVVMVVCGRNAIIGSYKV